MTWQPIDTAPKDGTPVDLWCVAPDDVIFETEPGYITSPGPVRLPDCYWHEGDMIFPVTGWVRLCDDGDLDLVEVGPCTINGLPSWTPTHWQPLPDPPAAREGE